MTLRHLTAVVFVSLVAWALVITAGWFIYTATTVEDSAPATPGISKSDTFTVQWTWDADTETWTTAPICTDAGVWHWRTSHQEWTLDQTTEARATCKL